jgi:hypothetical protein
MKVGRGQGAIPREWNNKYSTPAVKSAKKGEGDAEKSCVQPVVGLHLRAGGGREVERDGRHAETEEENECEGHPHRAACPAVVGGERGEFVLA